MSSSSKSVMSAAAIAEKRAALQAEIIALETAEQAVKQEEANKVTEVIKTFPSLLKKVLKREVSVSDMQNMIRYVEKHGSLAASLPSVVGAIDRTKLTEDEKAAVRADLLKRAGALKAGTAPEQMTVIAARHQVSIGTLNTYKPTQAEVDALPGANTVPISALKATA